MRRFEEKRTWVRAHLGDISSDGELLTAFAAEFSMKEAKASEELKQLMADDRATEDQFAGSSSQRLYALGQKLLDQMLQDKAHGPAAQVWKTMQSLKGLDRPQQLQVELTAAPSADVVRARIAKLMADQAVRDKAEAIGVDLDATAHDGELVETPAIDPMNPAARLARAASLASQSDGAKSDEAPIVANDERTHDRIEPENPLALHLAKSKELGPS